MNLPFKDSIPVGGEVFRINKLLKVLNLHVAGPL